MPNTSKVPAGGMSEVKILELWRRGKCLLESARNDKKDRVEGNTQNGAWLGGVLFG